MKTKLYSLLLKFSLTIILSIVLFTSAFANGKIYLVGDGATVNDLASNEKNAYNWALANYTTPAKQAVYISFSTIATSGVPSDCGLLWFHYTVSKTLPQNVLDAKEEVATYYNNGGNVFLTALGSKYAVEIGATTIATTEEGLNTAASADDAWGVCPVTGQEGHPIFAGLPSSTFPDAAWGGTRTVTNTAGQPTATEAFAWWHNMDFTFGTRLGICPWFKKFNDLSTMWTPIGEFNKGQAKVLFASLPGFTWLAINGADEQANLVLFTQNCINYTFKDVATSLVSTKADAFNLSVFPNPASTVLNIKATDFLENATYTIFSICGVEVLNGFVNNGTVQIASLPSGIYLLKVTTNAGSSHVRFQKY